MDYKAYKFKLLPTEEQKEILVQWIGCGRFIWNKMLEASIEQYKIYKAWLDKKWHPQYPHVKFDGNGVATVKVEDILRSKAGRSQFDAALKFENALKLVEQQAAEKRQKENGYSESLVRTDTQAT